jgi:hypothetical protein
MVPPKPTLHSAVRSDPTASSTARASSTQRSTVGGVDAWSGSDRPMPRRSMRMSRQNEPIRARKRSQRGWSPAASIDMSVPGSSSTSMAPSPTT